VIVDFDVHHGNGTEVIFLDDDSVLFVSLHQWPFYPGSGGPDDQAETTVNVPLPAGCGDEEYLEACARVVEPAVERFEPELVLVSAGFDAHADDPLASMRVTEDGFRELARRCRRALGHRVAAVLEEATSSKPAGSRRRGARRVHVLTRASGARHRDVSSTATSCAGMSEVSDTGRVPDVSCGRARAALGLAARGHAELAEEALHGSGRCARR
jgi:hypothetical protein